MRQAEQGILFVYLLYIDGVDDVSQLRLDCHQVYANLILPVDLLFDIRKQRVPCG